MIRAIILTLGKEFRLIFRDRVGLFMMIVAPIAVIAAAGFSLANVYGGDSAATTSYPIAVVNEDGGRVGQAIVDALGKVRSIALLEVPDRHDAETLVRVRKKAVLAVVIPPFTTEGLKQGRNPKLLVYTDPVKYVQSAKIELMLSQPCRSVSSGASVDARDKFDAASAHLRGELEQARTSADNARAEVAHLSSMSEKERERMAAHLKVEVADATADARAYVSAAINRAMSNLQRQVTEATAAQDAKVDELKKYFAQLSASEDQFREWLGKLQAIAGRHASDLPPPPAFPTPPADLATFNSPAFDLKSYRAQFERALAVPAPHIEMPAMPAIPAITIPDIPQVSSIDATIPGTLGYTEVDVEGREVGPVGGFNAFDLQVPGFAVTFLLIGMLMGVSLALLDERDWGTLERLRSVAAPFAATLAGKLFARFVVGFIQMIVLFAAGWALFGVSLGNAPAALMLPAAAIAFAGAAFGLVIAGLGSTRDAVLPVGAIVIMTMAAIGGCWWPIDFEPHWMRQMAIALPTTWTMQAFNDLIIRRLPAATAVVPSLVVAGFGVIYLAAGVVLSNRRFS
jgi:ABC-type Na+ efflux pump permease subunit